MSSATEQAAVGGGGVQISLGGVESFLEGVQIFLGGVHHPRNSVYAWCA